jgi:hypothetical protein
MSLDLDETASMLTDDFESIYLRAIRLFEFQICLFFPKALSSEKLHDWHANARLLAQDASFVAQIIAYFGLTSIINAHIFAHDRGGYATAGNQQKQDSHPA